ncbi:MAG TPA: YbhB/YbcL family Raf kinase inhibitor-like protein [Steroidobacteraceae bacterium]|nr:YbhB/YbcL family Raf kinase inhibitor-like protein [Steroidobacteraceae bacterium]
MFAIRSTAFTERGAIPRKFTADGEDMSPPLEWADAPAGTRSFCLIVDDPDAPDPRAPQRTWVHWVLYNIPATVHELRADADRQGLPAGASQGRNDWQRTGYGGPSPPVGRHRYLHKLYALDVLLPDLGAPTKAQLLGAMGGHVLGEAQLIGTYLSGR